MGPILVRSPCSTSTFGYLTARYSPVGVFETIWRVFIGENLPQRPLGFVPRHGNCLKKIAETICSVEWRGGGGGGLLSKEYMMWGGGGGGGEDTGWAGGGRGGGGGRVEDT